MSRDLSHDTRELLVLARGDAPTPKARDAMWDSLEKAILPATAVGLGTAAVAASKPLAAVATNPTAWHPVAVAATKPVALAAPTVAAAAPTTAASWLTAAAAVKVGIGAVLGTAVAITVAVSAMHKAPKLADDVVESHPAVVAGDEGAALAPPSFPASFSGTAAPSPPPAPPTTKEARAFRAFPRAALTNHATSDDTLLREASLVGEARSALLRGDPQTALVSVQAARREGRNLEPEELSIEARALRALGRESEAAALDGTLRARYPNNALAR
ncbi:hypothetical protein [Pendulispora albinea]|uniref:Uncharacterized protein n=1 Tax=Pendulispora albinea TaxID=2741071 RepID=A0ABZ2LS88_9BACT